MKCLYCGADNHEDDHRCRRCGRRLHIARPQAGPEPYPVLRTSPVPKPQPVASATATLDPTEPGAQNRQPAQTSLGFEIEGPRVIPFQTPASRRSNPSRRRGAREETPARRARVPGATNLELALRDTTPKGPEDDGPHAVLHGYARAASPMHRVLAAALDWSMILIGVGMFLLTFHMGGGELVFNKATSACFIAVPLLIALFYELMCALGGGTTVGMRWTHLRLLNFDGRKPNTEECLVRVFGTGVSMAAIGLGYVWALFDPENLAWQDHISKTFPTPSQIQQSF
jgi:uncharacterized RDD family membrane protein YckC